ncbi:MAG: GCN5-related N-acetyltransferase [Actinomycetia bacterium]|nr:GCN5-related N-acetyltransferase [Actinomycetes bacterium]
MLEIRPLSLNDDLDAQLDLQERAFGVISPANREARRRGTEMRIAAGRWLGAFLDGRPVGAASWHDMHQWWAGRAMPMAGVAGVTVAPDARGRGLGRQLMTEVLREIAAGGYPLSTLYPATMPIYRSLGWELAGGRYRAAIPARSLRSLARPDLPAGPNDSVQADLREAAPGDGTRVSSVLGRAHEASRHCGPVTRDVDSVENWLATNDHYRYISDDAFLAYRWKQGNEVLAADWAVAATPAAERGVWSILAGHSSIADTVQVGTWPGDPIWWLLRERDAQLVSLSMWMLRVVDAPSAVARRGFGRGVAGSVRMRVDDSIPVNAGPWELTIADGAGKLERAEAAPGALTMGTRGLAALYAGTPVPALRLAGLVAGGSPADDEFLAAAFPGPAWMLDDF